MGTASDGFGSQKTLCPIGVAMGKYLVGQLLRFCICVERCLALVGAVGVAYGLIYVSRRVDTTRLTSTVSVSGKKTHT